MDDAIHIRPATPADVPAMRRLEETSFPGDRLSLRSLRRLVRSEQAICLVAETGGLLAGDAVVLLRRNSVRARLYSVAVDPQRRGGGIGARLIAEAERRAAAAGRRTMHLEVRGDNERALRLYAALGYEPTGRKPGFYDDGAAAIVMARALPREPN
ncbi:MAG: GNAT family N-acetyltransferase [Alphaproteobacteria bacterium]|nr:GNAT family N-acetyltransferase [Alphaproteobacteria bacterium]